MNHKLLTLCRFTGLTVLTFYILVSPAKAQTLTLDSCIALAKRNNADLRTSQIEIEKAQLVKRQAFTKYFPQVSLNALGYYAANPIISFGINDIQSNDMRELLQELYDLTSSAGSDFKDEVTLMKKGASGSITAIQPLYAGGRIVTGNRLAKLGIEAAELQSEVKQRDIIENIESTYYLVTGLREKEATIESALELIDSLDRIVQTALAAGLVTSADALQIQLKRNEMLANRQQLTSGLRLAKQLLCCQIGIDFSETLTFVTTAFIGSINLNDSKNTEAQRPERRLLALNIEAEQLRRRMTLGETLPQLALIGMGYYGNLIKTNPTGNVLALLSLSVPLTAWWETSHRLRQHNLAIEEARLKEENLGRMLSLEEEKAYSDMIDALTLMVSDSAALNLARENHRLATLNYSAGNATISDVLQAHTLLLQAQNALTDRRTSYLVAHRRLQDLRGEN